MRSQSNDQIAVPTTLIEYTNNTVSKSSRAKSFNDDTSQSEADERQKDNLIKNDDVDAISIASMFHYNKIKDTSFNGQLLSPIDLKKKLVKRNIKCRL